MTEATSDVPETIIIGSPRTPVFQVLGLYDQEHPLFILHPDGSVDVPDPEKTEEAAQRFWAEVVRLAEHRQASLNATKREVADADAQRAAAHTAALTAVHDERDTDRAAIAAERATLQEAHAAVEADRAALNAERAAFHIEQVAFRDEQLKGTDS